ncbi:MAG: hypothetical protein LUD48_04965 [Prevotella sp.]|nr:hypothetical protein [Prevotella sp.]
MARKSLKQDKAHIIINSESLHENLFLFHFIKNTLKKFAVCCIFNNFADKLKGACLETTYIGGDTTQEWKSREVKKPCPKRRK